MSYYKEALKVTQKSLKKLKTDFTKKLLKEYNPDQNLNESKKLIKGYQKMLKKSFIFKINKTLTTMLVLTDNDSFTKEDLKLPYENVFLDCKFSFDDFALFGIALEEIYEGKKKNVKDILVGYLFFKRIENINTSEVDIVFKSFNDLDDKEDRFYELNQNVKSLIMNFLDFLNNPDIEFIKKEHTRENLKTYEKKYSSGYAEIILTGKLKKYIDDIEGLINENPSLLKKAHWVRGHWRRFYSNKFIHKQGTKTWIYPFIRGFGKPQKKDYQLKHTQQI